MGKKFWKWFCTLLIWASVGIPIRVKITLQRLQWHFFTSFNTMKYISFC